MAFTFWHIKMKSILVVLIVIAVVCVFSPRVNIEVKFQEKRGAHFQTTRSGDTELSRLAFETLRPDTTDIDQSKTTVSVDVSEIKKYGISNWTVITRETIQQQQGDIFPPNAGVPVTVNGDYIIANSAYCANILRLGFVVVVHTSPDHYAKRDAIRKTWGKTHPGLGINHRTVFFLGDPRDSAKQNAINRESRRWGDIVQGNFVDDYKNLTLKALMALGWVTKNCRHADYIIKVDDDVFVNIPKAVEYIFPILANNSKQVVCSVQVNGTIVRPRKNLKQNLKWVVSHNYFRNSTNYPMPFCYGFATFYSMSLGTELFNGARYTPFFHLDDVYVYGILASKVKGLTWMNTGKSFVKNHKTTRTAVNRTALLVGTANNPGQMFWIWQNVR